MVPGKIMSGATALLLVLSWGQGFAFDVIEPPQDLSIAVPTFGRVRVSWKHSIAPPNTTVTYTVKISVPGKRTETINTTYNSSSRYLDLQRGVTAEVAVRIKGPRSAHSALSEWVSKVLPAFPGVNGTSATDVSCQIDIDPSGKGFLSCSWTPGDKAPADTEYHLYYGYNNNIHRCKNYTVESGGQRRIGGRFPHIDIWVKNSTRVGVHINGTSKSLKIRAAERTFIANEIEKIPPVQNLTANGSQLYWSKPIQTLTDSCFIYNISVSSEGKGEKQITVSQLTFNVSEHRSAIRYFARVRAVGEKPCWTTAKYSSWTEIECSGEGADGSDAVGIIVAVCVIAAFITTFLLCISCWRYIFPEIPKPKNDLKEAFQNTQSQALMRCNSWDNEEVISYIDEMGPSEKGATYADYGPSEKGATSADYEPSEKGATSADYGHVADYSPSRLGKPL